MEVEIREFLRQFRFEDLISRKILFGPDCRLDGKSVKPLTQLMSESDVVLLTAADQHWFLNVNGSWESPTSRSRTKNRRGDLNNVRGIFNNQNQFINPFFQPKSDRSSEPTSE